MKKVLEVLGLNSLLTFLRRVKRLFEYIPIIWKTDDYDYEYVLEIFKYQLDRLSKLMEYKDRYQSTKHNVNRIKLINKLIDRVYINDYYHDEMLNSLYKLYHKDLFDLRLSNIEGSDNYEIKSEYELLDDKDLSNKISEEYEKYFQEYQDKVKKAKKLVWSLLHKDIERFWN